MRFPKAILTAQPVKRSVAALTALIASSCSLTTLDRTECTDDASCLAAFGRGHVCGAEGYCAKAADACDSNQQCRERNGFGFECNNASGRCSQVTPHPRCAKTFPARLFDAPEEFRDAIVFGSIAERGFDLDRVGENAAELALRQANEGQGLEGSDFGMVFCNVDAMPSVDSLDGDQAAVASGEFLAQRLGVPAIFGPTTSSGVSATFDALRGSGTLIISASATSPALTTLDETSPSDDRPGLFWRTVPPDSLQGIVIADDMLRRGKTNVAIITESGPYGEGLQGAFLDEFRARSGSIAGGQPFSFTEGSATSRDEQIVAAGATTADEVLFISAEVSDTIAFLKAANSSGSGYQLKSIFLTDTAGTTDLFGEDPPAELFGRVRLTGPAPSSGSVYINFTAAYAAAFDEDATQFNFSAQSYDATWMLVYGSAWSIFQDGGAVTGVGIGKGLRRLSTGDPIEVIGSNWPSIRQAFRQGNSVDLLGASGDINYDPATEETEAPIDVIGIVPQCTAGQFEFQVIPRGGSVTPPVCT